MAEIQLKVAVNRSQRVVFTQGEDRALTLLLTDEAQGLPLDLTGGQLVFSLPRYGGGSIKRRTGAVPFSWAAAQTLDGLSTITLVSHGLVSGDLVTLAAAGANPLPAPFAAATPYVVTAIDNDTFALLTQAGQALALTAPSSDGVQLSLADFAVGNALLGQAVLALSAEVTSACAIGQGQTWQLTYRAPDGLIRIYSATNQLDVYAQPLP